jgi:seryl-tRNA synthetase
MREFVCVGTAEQASAFRAQWLARAEELAGRLGLNHRIDKASDPFFGRTGQLLALSQVEQSLKYELLVPIYSQERPTACMSFNCHLDHFGETWKLRSATGAPVHTACVAFGLDRLALGLFVTHGAELERWPASARAALTL